MLGFVQGASGSRGKLVPCHPKQTPYMFKLFLNWQGKTQGILALQGFITACERQGTRQAQVPCCANPTLCCMA